ncbi:YaeF family permuted papain-like enzyme [Serratia rubidaea]|uniref:YaeF family permuted papain-like enzyme n=1 Tax=Serratia rubidaea TaxID=61652 RepID=UPI001F2D9CF2|nr:YaeF family permuted papain-like enzyme [Serratia rubidaea]UJD81492.1 YaeF family permuted papain-like enzyme [Serratia rubidaea]UJD86055.1 YaeF family permuted papain-like enzyme [Serratia rubidaea]
MTSLTPLLALLPIVLLTGCTMNIALSEREKFTPLRPVNIQFQAISSAPRDNFQEIDPAALQAGDLLFSSTIGLNSLGIRLFSASSVSHVAIYIGQGQVAEAVGNGVQIVSLENALAQSDKLFALRLPGLSHEQAAQIAAFARQKVGSRYNYRGIIKMMPFMMTKQLCSLNPFSQDFRQQCVQGLATAQLSSPTGDETSYFCSQFVLAAYQQAGHPLTQAEPGWISPGDLLHMREGDIATLPPSQSLAYIGHIKPGIYLRAKSQANNRAVSAADNPAGAF